MNYFTSDQCPRSSEDKIQGMTVWLTEGSGDSVKDPMITWLEKPPYNLERRQCVADTLREVAYITKQKYIWVRKADHATTRSMSPGGEKQHKPAPPHITIFTSNEPSYIELTGHAYVSYNRKTGNIDGLATGSELKRMHKEQNLELWVYGQKRKHFGTRTSNHHLKLIKAEEDKVKERKKPVYSAYSRRW